MLAAVGIANERRDTPATLYQDNAALAGALDTCAKGNNAVALGRRALVAFACSLNHPIEWRLAQLGQDRVRKQNNIRQGENGRRRRYDLVDRVCHTHHYRRCGGVDTG